MTPSVTPTSIADVQEAVLFAVPGDAPEVDGATPATTLRPAGGGSKTALSTPGPGEVRLDMSQLTGVIDYQPDECTFTALAGTPVEAVEALLAEHRQCLPFEPPLSSLGATIGGVVATGLNGPGRYHYGGVRDFLIGARFVDGEGRLVRGGGRVVKNAAGFYLHHLLLGSLGRLGVLVDLTFKVFPLPGAVATLRVTCASLAEALSQLAALRCSAFEVDALELDPPATLSVRLAGTPAALPARMDALARFFGATHVDVLDEASAKDFWHEAREMTWAGDHPLVKVATTLGTIAKLDGHLDAAETRRRYGAGGEVAWVAWPRPLAELDEILGGLGVPGVILCGEASPDPYLGRRPDAAFLERVRRTFDPRGTFGRRRE